MENKITKSLNNIFKSKKNRQRFFLAFWELTFIVIAIYFFGNILNRWFFETASASFVSDWPDTSEEKIENTQIGNVNMLVVGVDSVEGTHRSDTIFLLSINPSKSTVTMLSIPRDTRVLIDGKGRKINEILPRFGANYLKNLLEQLFKITINRYVEVGYTGFVSVVDIMDGIDINVEKAMNYDDNAGNLHIHFKPGLVHLDGRRALEYVRFRADAQADLGRIKRQQQFVKAVINKMFTAKNFIKLPTMASKVLKAIKTDLTVAEGITIAKSFTTYNINFKHMSLPGEARYIDKISFFVPYQDRSLEIGASYFSDLTALELDKNYSIKVTESK